ncbi:MAG: anhydro-N-acetylmuramic acid kinase [FCB group bacterium]|nr:anhydro-N-acetylmuramic acid kinase [FCB group bacterium]
MTEKYRVLGLMSGTSMDGLDCLLCDIRITGNFQLEYEIIDFRTYPYAAADRKQIQSALNGDTQIIQDTSARLGQLFAEYSLDFLKGRKIDLIGSHGQTVAHNDGVSTLQIGDVTALVKNFNVPAVYDFRTADINAGGNGAPLVPFLDWLLYRNSQLDTITLNIGGIANISWIPAGGTREDVLGFDTGPGMALIDECALRFWKTPLDHDGELSAKGNIDFQLLDQLLAHEFIQKSPPKSTGRHEFGAEALESIIIQSAGIKPENLLRTLVAFTAKSISVNIRKYLKFRPVETRMILCGGGAHHPILMSDLKAFLKLSAYYKSEELGLHQDLKESLLIAVLAVARLQNIPANMPGVTGAGQTVVLGKVKRNHE